MCLGSLGRVAPARSAHAMKPLAEERSRSSIPSAKGGATIVTSLNLLLLEVGVEPTKTGQLIKVMDIQSIGLGDVGGDVSEYFKKIGAMGKVPDVYKQGSRRLMIPTPAPNISLNTRAFRTTLSASTKFW